ncbi:hypothetical protein [Echinicola sp. 20G]|uniref:hypothetical protein n=1 Tax=Echinicola sp. 20G TaxID=2781961 RepID=UPI0019102693|nr:hypothetical protein [Echinicola sp. 20G]
MERDSLLIRPVPMSGRDGFLVRIYEVGSSKLISEIPIPYEGPEALKGGRGANYYVLKDLNVLLVGSLGYLAMYDQGKKIREWNVDLNLPTTKESYIKLSTRKGLMVKQGEWLQVGQNPMNFMKFREPDGGLPKVEFPLDFTHWLTQVNLKTGQVRHTDFIVPGGYDEFKEDVSATGVIGTLDTKRGEYYLGWPYSDTLYKLNGVKLVEKIGLTTSMDFNYKPKERIGNVYVLPKDGTQHVFLHYDNINDIFLRVSKVRESGVGETKAERTKHYSLQVFSETWKPLGEYSFEFSGEIEVENWFISNGCLYINKPEREIEDEYEFYRIDLSRVKKPKR